MWCLKVNLLCVIEENMKVIKMIVLFVVLCFVFLLVVVNVGFILLLLNVFLVFVV